jgi:hypothetical protein
MELAVMCGTERDGPLITDLEAPGARLGKGEMMGMSRLTAADQARMARDETKMLTTTQPFWGPDGELTFIDGS